MGIEPHELLSRVEERDLIARVQSGDNRALIRLVQCNQRLIASTAKRYSRLKHLQFEDLMSAGKLGLITAIHRFDLASGNRLSTYASQWIFQTIDRAVVHQERAIRQPAYVVSLQQQIRRFIRTQSHKPSLENIAAELELTCDRVLQIIDADAYTGSLASLNEPIAQHRHKQAGEATALGELLSVADCPLPEAWTDAALLRDAIEFAIAKLTPDQAAIVRLRFGFDGSEMRSFAEVGDALGLSKQAVQQQLQTALRQLKPLLRQFDLQAEPALTLHKNHIRAQLSRSTIQRAIDPLGAAGGKLTVTGVRSCWNE
ncbi:MAG: sigma-70 family RNA polymerase sigma factor [Leptolyngbyaceae cyanobacterium SM1_3_5]|nr:sigma-70 family RNA polymerase sigma factor [Leptolyngbyaceae cyanobacterium SM1_3_5]